MKSRLFLISGILMLSCLTAFPCGYPDPIEPQWHWFFYTGYNSPAQAWQQQLNQAFREENITFWHNRVKGKVSREEVEKALYELYLLNEQTDNKFFRYLYDHHDAEALRYWTLLKTTDTAYIQKAVWERSAWYYSETTGERYWYYDEELPQYDLSISQVKTLDESAIRNCPDPDIRNRFLLQVMRKCFYVDDYQGCITLWERYGKQVPKSVLRKQCLNYYGGALRRVDRDAEAAIVYASIGFYDPRLHYDVEVLRKIYEKEPDSKAFAFMVQEFVNTYFDQSRRRRYSPDFDYSDPAGYLIPDTRKSEAFNALADEIVREGKNRNPALWVSAKAALAYINGDNTAALRLIGEADKLRGTPAVKDNIRMMRLVFNSTRNDIDANYESILLPDLQWLVHKIEKEGIPDWWDLELAGEFTDNPNYTALHNIKILRRTILLGIIPHFEQRGMAFKSMAYLNFYEEFMADDNMKKVRNYARRGMLREGIGRFGDMVYFHPPIYREEYLSEYDYDHSYTTNRKLVLVADSIACLKNFDYNTQFFNYMDTTSIANVQQYVRFLRSGGRTAAEKFVLQHSYRDLSFYNELLATKYMRLEKYDSALVYLRKMSPDFPNKQNIAEYIGGTHRNAFAEGWISVKKNKANFGLPFNPAAEYDRNPCKATFCQLMLRLRKLAETDPSAEIRAKAAYAYAVGLFRSTIGNAWALCYYENGWNFSYHNYGEEYYDEQSIEADVHRRVNGWLDKALRYDGDRIFTLKCTILHSEKKRALMRVEEVKHDYGDWCWTETVEEFLPIVRETFCDRGCDYDPNCTDEWLACVWYY
jgi:hypothetical protein